MRGIRRVILAGLLLVPATVARAEGTVPPGYHVAASTRLHEGVEHLVMTAANPEEYVNVARVAPGAPVALKTVSAHDAIPHRNADHELPSDMCRRVSCIAGINGDFHDLASDQPLGGFISGGRLIRSPRAGYDQFTLARNGTLHAGQLGWSGSLVPADGAGVALTGVNVDRGANDVVLYTRAWGGSTPAGAENEIVLRVADGAGALGTTTVQIVGTRRSSGGIPADGAVLSGTGSAGAALGELATKVNNRTVPAKAELRLQTAIDAVESVGVNPVLLRNGKRAFPIAGNGFTTHRSPRTVLGWNPAGEIFLVTVDGRRDDADGMNLAQAADLLAGLGATDAVNFDGGGGTTFVVAGEVKNLPSDPGNPGTTAYPDGHEIAPGHVERMAPNALVIVRQSADPPPPSPSGSTTTTLPGATAGSPGSGPGTDEPGPGGHDILVTDGGWLQTVGSIGDAGPAEGDPAFTTSGAGGLGRLFTPAPDREQSRGRKGKGKGSDAVGNLNGDWLPGMPPLPGGTREFSALPDGPAEDGGRLLSPGFTMASMVAAGMILTVLAGISRVREDRRTRPALWL